MIKTIEKKFLFAPTIAKSKIVVDTANDIETLQKDREISNTRIFSKGFGYKSSQILCKSSSLFLLFLIQKKDKSFSIPVPDSFVLNCDFEGAFMVKHREKLSFTQCNEGLTGVRHKILETLKENYLKPPVPSGIIKYMNGRKKLLNNPEEIFENLSDLSQNLIVQQYITPKGFRITKHRVILSDRQVKIYIIANNFRYDFQSNSKLPIKNSKIEEESSVRNSVINYKKCMKFVNNLSLKKLPCLDTMSAEKQEIFEVFKIDPTLPKKKVKKVEELELGEVEKFVLKIDLQKSQFYEGSAGGFVEIVKMCEYLKEKIDIFVLGDEVLTELAVDFLQDSNGKWVLLNIVHGLTKKYVKVHIDVRKSNTKLMNKSTFSEFSDKCNENSEIIHKLLRPDRLPDSKFFESFSFHKKFYGFD